jgi:hypothetical protein
MVVGAVAFNLYGNRILGTFAYEFATSKVGITLGYTIIDSWMDRERCSH